MYKLVLGIHIAYTSRYTQKYQGEYEQILFEYVYVIKCFADNPLNNLVVNDLLLTSNR